MFQDTLEIKTPGRCLVEVTGQIEHAVRSSGVSAGLCHLFLRHTSAAILITENADPDVLRDLETFLGDLVPDGDRRFAHTAEGPDDMPAHVRTVLNQTSITVPVSNGSLALGTWQGIFLWEHRHKPHTRELMVTVSA